MYRHKSVLGFVPFQRRGCQRRHEFQMCSTPYSTYLCSLVQVTASHSELNLYYLRSMPLATFSSLNILVCFIESHTCWIYQHIFLFAVKLKSYHAYFVNFTIAVLNQYYFTAYHIVLPMSISAWLFYALSIHCRCIIYVTT